MSRVEGGDALRGSPSLWSGVRWRRRRAWRQPRSTSGSCERSRAPTRPASGPPSGTPGTRAIDGRARAGREPGSFRAVSPAVRPQGQRQPLPSGIPASDLHSRRGGSPSAARTWGPSSIAGAHSPVTLESPLAFLQAGAVLVLPPRLVRSWATRARPADGGS